MRIDCITDTLTIIGLVVVEVLVSCR